MNEAFEKELSDAERALLRTLRGEPSWRSLLEKLAPQPISTFRLDKPADSQYSVWVYESGFADGANNILEVLK